MIDFLVDDLPEGLLPEEIIRDQADRVRRSHRKGRNDLAFGLTRTHRFTSTDNPITTATVFPGDRLYPITIDLDLKLTASGTFSGTIFEFSTAAAGGLAAEISGNDITFACGGIAGANDGADITVTNAVLGEAPKIYRLTFCAHPGIGVVNLFVDGVLKGAAKSVDGDFAAVGLAPTSAGAIGATATDNTTRITGGTLTDATIVGPVDVFLKQLPRQFHRNFLGTAGGTGSYTRAA